MNIKIKYAVLKKLLVNHPDPVAEDRFEYYGDDRDVQFEINNLTEAALKDLLELVEGDWDSVKKINTFMRMQKDPESKKVARLEALEVALKSYLKDNINHWLFEEDDGRMLPGHVQAHGNPQGH